MAIHCHTGQAMPAASLLEIHDLLILSLEATERPSGYSQPEREARSYVRAALRRTKRLMGVRA